jgi:hypothetical protein
MLKPITTYIPLQFLWNFPLLRNRHKNPLLKCRHNILFLLFNSGNDTIQSWIQSLIFLFQGSPLVLKVDPSHSYRLDIKYLLFFQRVIHECKVPSKYIRNFFRMFYGCVKILKKEWIVQQMLRKVTNGLNLQESTKNTLGIKKIL